MPEHHPKQGIKKEERKEGEEKRKEEEEGEKEEEEATAFPLLPNFQFLIHTSHCKLACKVVLEVKVSCFQTSTCPCPSKDKRVGNGAVPQERNDQEHKNSTHICELKSFP